MGRSIHRNSSVARRLAAALLAALGFVAVAGCGGGSTEGNGDTVTLDYLHWGPLAGPEAEAAQAFAEEVEQQTDGAVIIRVHPPGELPYQSDQALTAVASGGVDIAAAYSGFVAGTSKMAGLLQLPFLVNGTSELVDVFPTFEPYLDQELESRFNAQLLYWYAVPVLNAFGKGEPVRMLSDLASRDIRATSPAQVEFLERVGANPSNLSSGELAPALQTGVVDGFLASALFTDTLGLIEQIDWAYTPGINAGPVYVAINSESLEQVPANARETLKAAATKYGEQLLEQAPQRNADAIAKMKEAGVTVTQGDPADVARGAQLMRAFWESFASEGGPEVEEALAKVTEHTAPADGGSGG